MTTRVENTYFCRFLTSHKILTVRHLVYFVPHPIPRENARGGTYLQDILDPHMVLHDCRLVLAISSNSTCIYTYTIHLVAY